MYIYSTKLAEVLKSKHKQVLKSIDKEVEALQGLEEQLAGFQPTTYKDSCNRTQRVYLLSEDAVKVVVAKQGVLERIMQKHRNMSMLCGVLLEVTLR